MLTNMVIAPLNHAENGTIKEIALLATPDLGLSQRYKNLNVFLNASSHMKKLKREFAELHVLMDSISLEQCLQMILVFLNALLVWLLDASIV